MLFPRLIFAIRFSSALYSIITLYINWVIHQLEKHNSSSSCSGVMYSSYHTTITLYMYTGFYIYIYTGGLNKFGNFKMVNFNKVVKLKCRVKKQMLVPHFFENIFRSGFTLVSFNNIITIKIDSKIFCLKPQENKQTKKII